MLPVYEAMLIALPNTGTRGLMTSPTQWNPPGTIINLRHYTSASFARLISVAVRRLNLDGAHFDAAFDSDIIESGLLLAPNFLQEKVSNQGSICMMLAADI